MVLLMLYLTNQIPYYNATDPLRNHFISLFLHSLRDKRVDVLRGRGRRIDGHVGASQPSEGGFVALCAQRVAAVAAAAAADGGDDERSGRSPIAFQQRSSGSDATFLSV